MRFALAKQGFTGNLPPARAFLPRRKGAVIAMLKPTVALAQEPTLEQDLVAVGQTRDRASFARIFSHFAPRVKSYLMKQGMAEDAAEEIAQATLFTVWQKAAQFDPAKAAASTWIFTIARNKRIDTLRQSARMADDFDMEPLADTATEAADKSYERRQNARKLAQAIQSLPPEQADLLKKAFFEDKSHSVLAQETKLPLGTVKSRLRLAIEKLRKEMGEVSP